MKHFNFSILHRTAIQLSRARMLLLLFVTMIAAISWAQTEGPWTYLSHRSAFTNFDQYNSTAYNYLGGSVWGNCYVQQYNNANDRTGLGIEIRGNSSAGQKNCVFSIYTHTENILSYSRKVMHWNYKFKSSSNAHVQTTALYARDDIDAIKNMEVDFTQDYTNQSNSKYRIALLKGVCYEYKSEEFTHDFEFDNRNSGTAADKKWALLMTYVIGNGGGSMNIDQYAGFRNISCSWTTYYYKHITFDKNGGSGSMSKTTIENSGELPACTLTRDGYCFAGWNTQADGSGIPYADQASVTATESDKGEVKLYAQWVSIASNLQAEFLQKDRKVKLTWTTQKGQAGAGKFVIYRNGVKIGTIDHTFLNNETSDFVYEDANTASESDFPNESEIIYDVCFVLNGWAEDIKLPELKASKTVNTTRKVPVNSIRAISQADRIIFTWTSDAYPLNWGNRFNIFVDDETTPIYTITPTDNQTSFQWEHRRDISHADRQNGVDGTIPYTSQSGLDVCSPHNYRIEGVIGETVLNAVTVNNRSIGGGMPTATWRDERCASMRYIAKAYAAKGDISAAEAWCWRAIAEAPHLREPFMDLALLLYQKKDWEGVAYLTGRALQITDRPGTYITESAAWGSLPWDLRSLGLYYTGQTEKALEAVNVALRLSPSDERLKNNQELILEACEK